MDQTTAYFGGLLGLGKGAHSGGTHLILPGFEQPAWLLLILPLMVWCWWVARRSLSGGTPARQVVQLAVRCLVVLLLCGALAQPRVRWRANDVAVMTVLDVSASIPSDQQRLAREFLGASLERRVSSDRFGIVTIAREPLVQSLATSHAPTTDVASHGRSNRSPHHRCRLPWTRRSVPPPSVARSCSARRGVRPSYHPLFSSDLSSSPPDAAALQRDAPTPRACRRTRHSPPIRPDAPSGRPSRPEPG